jgi:hypothetical protein
MRVSAWRSRRSSAASVQPMESFFTLPSFAAWNPGVQKLYALIKQRG